MVVEVPLKLVFVGLGNPGRKYAKTRHNLGFLVVEQLASSLGWPLIDDKRFKAKTSKGRLNEAEVHLLLPQTYMNESGWSVRQYLDYYQLEAGQLVVVADDTALKFGHLRLRRQGSAGGHNGLKSIIAHLGLQEFSRLRMGIGSQPVEQSLADYVLSDFSAEEAVGLDEFVKRGAAILKSLTAESIAKVMNRVNIKINVVDLRDRSGE